MKTCARAGCPELLDKGEAYCSEHTRSIDRAIKARSTWRWVYSSPLWKGLRRQVKTEQPWCAIEGCFELTHDVDHIKALQDGGAPFDRSNVQGLCRAHHSKKTAEEVHGRQ